MTARRACAECGRPLPLLARGVMHHRCAQERHTQALRLRRAIDPDHDKLVRCLGSDEARRLTTPPGSDPR